jgi:hypothetical protein
MDAFLQHMTVRHSSDDIHLGAHISLSHTSVLVGKASLSIIVRTHGNYIFDLVSGFFS